MMYREELWSERRKVIGQTTFVLYAVYFSMDFPYSVYVYEASLSPSGQAYWNEALRTNTEQWAVYLAGLLHQAGVPHADTMRNRPVVKAVRYGIAFLCLPDEHTVELVERQITKQKHIQTDIDGLETTFF